MQRSSTGAKGLVFGGIMAALVVVFALVPFLALLMPIPLVLTYVRYGGRTSGLASVVAVLFSALFVGPLQAFLLVPGGILPGLVFGYGFRHRLRPLTIGVVAVLVFFLGYAAQYIVTRAAMFGGRDPIAAAFESETGRAQTDSVLTLLERITALPDEATDAQRQVADLQKAWMQEFRRDPAGVTWVLLPFSLFLFGSFFTWLNYILCRAVLPRFGHPVPPPTPFGEFRIPAWLTWIFVALTLGSAFVGVGFTMVGAPWWVQLLINVLPPLTLIFMLAGIAVAYGYLRRRSLTGPAAAALSLAGLLLGNVGIQLYIFLAMWDTIFDFRKLGHGIWKRPEGSP